MFWQVPNQHLSQNISQEHVDTDPRGLQLMFWQVPSQHLSQNISQRTRIHRTQQSHSSIRPGGMREAIKYIYIYIYIYMYEYVYIQVYIYVCADIRYCFLGGVLFEQKVPYCRAPLLVELQPLPNIAFCCFSVQRPKHMSFF